MDERDVAGSVQDPRQGVRPEFEGSVPCRMAGEEPPGGPPEALRWAAWAESWGRALVVEGVPALAAPFYYLWDALRAYGEGAIDEAGLGGRFNYGPPL
ncbi:hypothetical protein LCGC14_1982840 [marine sediment metagenome]|uniref:Uncharacterized protein n=1 Tax=marine sediment metagenome TaxID=412755 RepID=A0A0F9FWK4_9ZZZZ